MCPACLTAIATWSGVASAGGATAWIAVQIRRRRLVAVRVSSRKPFSPKHQEHRHER